MVNIWIYSYCFAILITIASGFLYNRQHFHKSSHISSTSALPAVCNIRVIGVGGGGGNAVNRIIRGRDTPPGVQFWAVNTDSQALAGSLAEHKLNIGKMASRYFFILLISHWSFIQFKSFGCITIEV